MTKCHLTLSCNQLSEKIQILLFSIQFLQKSFCFVTEKCCRMDFFRKVIHSAEKWLKTHPLVSKLPNKPPSGHLLLVLSKWNVDNSVIAAFLIGKGCVVYYCLQHLVKRGSMNNVTLGLLNKPNLSPSSL